MRTPITSLVLLCVVLLAAAGCTRKLLPEEYYDPKTKAERPQRPKIEVEAEEIKTIGPMRTWTSSNGQSKVEGAMISLEGDRVWILRKDGIKQGMPLSMLSEADQEYARQTAAGRPAP